MTKNRNVATCLFIDRNLNVWFQDRTGYKTDSQEFRLGLFGGAVEKSETVVEAFLREISEELSYAIKDFVFLDNNIFEYDKEPYFNHLIIVNIFLAPIPNDIHVKLNEGKAIYKMNLADLEKTKDAWYGPEYDYLIKLRSRLKGDLSHIIAKF